MAEAASTYIMNDSALLDLIANHHRLWQEWDRRVAADRNPDTQLLSVRCDELARRIIATPAHTREALDGKLRVVEVADYNDGDSLIIETILELDAERVERAASATEGDGA